MRVSPSQLLGEVGLVVGGRMKWGTLPKEGKPGVYVVSRSCEPSVGRVEAVSAPIDRGAVRKWIERRGEGIRLDGKRATNQGIVDLLSEFWLADASVVYIGMTKLNMRKRMWELYRYELGERSMGRGGGWLHTLENKGDLWVHYGVEDLGLVAKEMHKAGLDYFVKENEGRLPYANLAYWDGRRKQGRLRGEVMSWKRTRV